jgi:hypothetical protein
MCPESASEMHFELGTFLPCLSDSFAHRSSRLRRRDGQNLPKAALSGRFVCVGYLLQMPVLPALARGGQF